MSDAWIANLKKSLKLLILYSSLLTIPVLISCKKGGKENLFKGMVLLEGQPQVGIYIKNLNTKESSVSDKKGRFSIGAEVGDLILFEMGEYGICVKVGGLENEQKVELKKLKKKVFHFRNYESFLFQGEIFIVIPETRYLSPVLSNGTVIFYFPDGLSEAFIVSATSYAKLELESIQEFEVIDLQKLNFTNLPEKVKVLNLSKENIVLEDIFGEGKTEISPKGLTTISPGIYNVINRSKTIENFVVVADTQISEFGSYPRQEALIGVKGKATTLFGERGILIWAEMSGMVRKSDPLFSANIPRHSRRIFFSKFAKFPEVVKVDDSAPGDIEVYLTDASYIGGYIYPGNQTYFINIEDPSAKNPLLTYKFSSTDFLVVLPHGKIMAISITSPGLVPRLIIVNASSPFIDLGTIFLCSIEDEDCIIEEGKAFLRFGLYKEAREVFKFAHSDVGKMGLIVADLGLMLSDLSLLLSDESKSKFYTSWMQIYDEMMKTSEELISKGTPYRFCHDRIPLFAISRSFTLGGCIEVSSLKFITSVLEIVKAVKLYLYGHRLGDGAFSFAWVFSPEPGLVGKLGAVFSSSPEILRREKYFDPSTSVSLLISGLRNLADAIKGLKDCQANDELVCLDDGTVNIRGGGSYIPIMNSKPEFQKIIDSLGETYELGISDVISFLPLPNPAGVPDFFRVNLGKLLKNNDLRSFFPSVITRNGVPFLAVEVEVPSGFRGMEEGSFAEPIFYVGDSPHFWYTLEPMLLRDGTFPESTTEYFQDFKDQEFIVYFYFDDPTFGGALKVLPCSLPVSQEIGKRWCSKDDTQQFRFPTNQMLNDVLAIVQKHLKLQFLFMFTSIQIPSLIF